MLSTQDNHQKGVYTPMCDYHNTSGGNSQDCELHDTYIGKSGRVRERPWRAKKLQNELLAMAYDQVNPDKAARLRDCGRNLTFRVYPDGTRKLDSMVSCRVRLCPMCTWRRSLVNFANNIAIVNYLEQQQPRAWLFGTFTLRRCGADQLDEQISRVLYGWKKLLLNTDVKRAVKGSYRGLEVTHDIDPYITPESYKLRKDWCNKQGLSVGDSNPTYNTYHVHIHAVFCVNVSYFKNKTYLKRADWAAAWQQALGIDYEPSVDIRRVKPDCGSYAGAVGEVSKYSTKAKDYIVPDDWDLTVDTVRLLDCALAGRRLVGYSGVMLAAKRALKLQDEATADLTHIDGEYADRDGSYQLVTYFWTAGYRQEGGTYLRR